MLNHEMSRKVGSRAVSLFWWFTLKSSIDPPPSLLVLKLIENKGRGGGGVFFPTKPISTLCFSSAFLENRQKSAMRLWAKALMVYIAFGHMYSLTYLLEMSRLIEQNCKIMKKFRSIVLDIQTK